ncbi:hypothetical protein D3C75_919700 [compost metagenome]
MPGAPTIMARIVLKVLALGEVGQEPEHACRTRLFDQAVPGCLALSAEQLVPGSYPIGTGVLVDHPVGVAGAAPATGIGDAARFVEILDTAFVQGVVVQVEALQTQAQSAHFPL